MLSRHILFYLSASSDMKSNWIHRLVHSLHCPCSCRLGAIIYWILILVLQVTKCLTLGKSLHFSERVEPSLFAEVLWFFWLITLPPFVEHYLSMEVFRLFVKCFVTRTPEICMRSTGIRYTRDLGDLLIQCPRFADEETKSPEGVGTCLCNSRTRIGSSLPTERPLYSYFQPPGQTWILIFTNWLSCLFWWTLMCSLGWNSSAKNVWSVFFLSKFTRSQRHFLWLRIQLIRKHPKFRAFRGKCLVQSPGKWGTGPELEIESFRETPGRWCGRLSLQSFRLPKLQMDSPHCQIDWLKHHCQGVLKSPAHGYGCMFVSKRL